MAQAQQIEAPVGVKVLTGLAILAGLIMVVGGVALMALASQIPLALIPPEQMPLVPFVVSAVGVTLIVIGSASILLAVGLFRGVRLAWRAMTVIAFIGIVVAALSVLTGDITMLGSAIINGAILYYLYRPNVKQYFGRARLQAAS